MPFLRGTFVAQGASRGYISVWCNCGARGPEVALPEHCIEPSKPISECYDLWNIRVSDDTHLATEQKLVAVVEEAAQIADMHAAFAWTVDAKREAQSIAKAIRASSKAPTTGDTADE